MKVTGIKEEACTRCGLCNSDCPPELFKIENDSMVFRDPLGHCIKCGHCVAICPTNAVEYKALSEGDELFYQDSELEDIDADLTSRIMKNTMFKRRSVRKYKTEQVKSEELEQIMEVMGRSPSASNKMLRKYYVYQNREQIEAIDDSIGDFFKKLIKMGVGALPLFLRAMAMKDKSRSLKEKKSMLKEASMNFYDKIVSKQYRFLFHAPTLIVITAPENPPAHYKTFLNSDAHNAATHGVLMAESLGLGTCWIGFLEGVFNKKPKVKEQFGIPKGERVLAAFTLGYPDIKYQRAAPRGPVPVKFFK